MRNFEWSNFVEHYPLLHRGVFHSGRYRDFIREDEAIRRLCFLAMMTCSLREMEKRNMNATGKFVCSDGAECSFANGK